MRKTDSRRRTATVLFCGLAFLVLVGTALATDPFNVIRAPVQARGTLDESQIVNSKSGVHVKTKGSTDIVTQEIVLGGGGHTGWHSHPGPVLVTVKSGALRLIYADDESCVGTLYQSGDSFIDRGDEIVHIARNESLLSEVVFWATYFVPGDPGAPFRLSEPDPGIC